MRWNATRPMPLWVPTVAFMPRSTEKEWNDRPGRSWYSTVGSPDRLRCLPTKVTDPPDKEIVGPAPTSRFQPLSSLVPDRLKSSRQSSLARFSLTWLVIWPAYVSSSGYPSFFCPRRLRICRVSCGLLRSYW